MNARSKGSLLADNVSIGTCPPTAKPWGCCRTFWNKNYWEERHLKSRKHRKRDILKSVFTKGWAGGNLSSRFELCSLFFDTENNCSSNYSAEASCQSLFSAMQEAKANTLLNRSVHTRDFLGETEAANNSLKTQNEPKNSSASKSLSLRSIKVKIRHRLAKKSQSSNDLGSDLHEIPPELTKTIASCVLDSRSFASTENSLLEDLDIKEDMPLATCTPESKVSPRSPSEDSPKFTPRYQHNFHIEPPPRNLPRGLHAKWERSQMLKNTARTYDHEKWKSKQLLSNQENYSEDENIDNSIGTKLSNRNASASLFENLGKLFVPNTSSKVSTSSPSSIGTFLDTPKLFLPLTPKLGNLSSRLSFKNRKISNISESTRLNSISSAYSRSTISSSRNTAKGPYSVYKKLDCTGNYSQDTFYYKKANLQSTRRQNDETFSEFSF